MRLINLIGLFLLLLSFAVEGQNLCKECAAKIDLPDGVLNSMTLDEFREYINCYDANKPLRDSFTETYRYDFGFFKGSLLLDMDHQLLRLGQTDLLAALDMVYFHSGLKFTGTDAHESDTVTVRLIHIRLDLKYEGGEIRSERIDHAVCRSSRKRRSRHI